MVDQGKLCFYPNEYQETAVQILFRVLYDILRQQLQMIDLKMMFQEKFTMYLYFILLEFYLNLAFYPPKH